MPPAPQDLRQFESLLQIMQTLRAPGGCPWDQEQTHASLARFAIEEAYELVEAIEATEALESPETQASTSAVPIPKASASARPFPSALVEELGDVLLQVVFHAELGRSRGEFSIADVIEAINRKMVFRHPHVFSDTKVRDRDEVLENWDRLKGAERDNKNKSKTASFFDIPLSLPALDRATKIGEQTRRAQFDWTDVPGVLTKMREEIDELEEAYAEGTIAEHEHELGDVLFTVAQVARHLGVNAEQALRKTNVRFETRYVRMLALMKDEGHDLQNLSAEQKEIFWQRAKKSLGETGRSVRG